MYCEKVSNQENQDNQDNHNNHDNHDNHDNQDNRVRLAHLGNNFPSLTFLFLETMLETS